jgi:glucose-6-phosphate isomerase
MVRFNDTAAHAKLQSLAAAKKPIKQLFESDPQRFERLSIEACGLLFDPAKTSITTDVRAALTALADEMQLNTWRESMFSGEAINDTEDRAVLHIALRDRSGAFAELYGADIKAQVQGELDKMRSLSDTLRSQQWLGFTGKPIRHVVNIGIGGSDLGPKMVCEALRAYQDSPLTVRFVSSVDETHLLNELKACDPEETLFTVSSKTFTTQETMTNAHAARRWLLQALGDEAAIARHFIAVTTNNEEAARFGIAADNMLTFWDWVGGRYSLWSSIGFPIAIALGFERFEALLAGAHAMDQHFYHSAAEENMPIQLAMTGVWHNNFLGHHSLAVIPYNDALELLPPFLQQLDMESNGKTVSRSGERIDYATGPVVWGQSGSNGQHAFFQLLHQGSEIVPIEFVTALNKDSETVGQHRILLSNMLAQANAFMAGQTAEEGKPYTQYDGDKPSVNILMDALTPERLGALIALYEHKVFVQGVVWGINSYDQWGVQLGKKLANSIGTDFTAPDAALDASSKGLMAWIEQRL